VLKPPQQAKYICLRIFIFLKVLLVIIINPTHRNSGERGKAAPIMNEPY